MTLETILTFLTENKTIIVGAVVTLTEVATIVINFVRKTKSDAKVVQTMIDSGTGTSQLAPKASVGKKLLWSANPINLFKRLP